MSVKTKYYVGSPGSTGFFDAELSNTTILWVTRTGMVHTVITVGEAANQEVLYLAAGGGIFFDPNIPFTGPPPDEPVALSQLEKISVKFKY